MGFPNDSNWVKTYGFCGMAAAVVGLAGIAYAAAMSESFNWWTSQLADLGNEFGPPGVTYNLCIVIAGIHAVVFGFGLAVSQRRTLLGRIGNIEFLLAAVALTLLGAFPKNYDQIHAQASAAFFILFPISMFFLSADFAIIRKYKQAALTLALSAIVLIAWVLKWLGYLGSGVAIPQAMASACIAIWTFVFGYIMFWRAGHMKNFENASVGIDARKKPGHVKVNRA